jgi:hypothetical protein
MLEAVDSRVWVGMAAGIGLRTATAPRDPVLGGRAS